MPAIPLISRPADFALLVDCTILGGKAPGGERPLAQAPAMNEAGATRIGASSGVTMVSEVSGA